MLGTQEVIQKLSWLLATYEVKPKLRRLGIKISLNLVPTYLSKLIPLPTSSSYLQEHCFTCSSRPSSNVTSSNPADPILNSCTLSVHLSKNLFSQPRKSFLVCCPPADCLLLLIPLYPQHNVTEKMSSAAVEERGHLLLQACVWAHSSLHNPRNRKSCQSQLSCHHQNGFWIRTQRWHLVWSCTFWLVFPEFLS